MSVKTKVDQEYKQDKNANSSPDNLLEHQYSREELITLSKSPASVRRPKCLEQVYVSDEGKWDPELWYKAKFGLAREASPLTLGNGKEQRKITNRDRDFKKRASPNNPVERLKEEKDGIVLSPQRRSFGTGCHVQTTARQKTLPDREDSKGDRDRDRDKERDREKPVKKVGSGRLPADREKDGGHDFSNHHDDHDHGRDHERDRDFAWSRDKDKERERNWGRDLRDREMRDSNRDRRFDRNDRFRRVGEKDNKDRDWRDREFRDKGFDRNSRRRNNGKSDEKEPEWFTGGPSSQTDTIELRGFDREDGNRGDEMGGTKPAPKSENKPVITVSMDRFKKESSEKASEVHVKVTQQNSSGGDQQMLQNGQQVYQNMPSQKQQVYQNMPSQKQQGHQNMPGQKQQGHQNMPNQKQQEENTATISEQNSRTFPQNKSFDFEEILNTILRLDENGIQQGSRFSRFFSGPGGNVLGNDASSLQDILVPCEDNQSRHASPVSASMVGPMGAMQHAHLGMHHFQGQEGEQTKPHTFTLPAHLMCVPNSAGDNNATPSRSSLPPSVTAFFNSAAQGGSNACKWNARQDCSLETPESSFLTDSAISSSSSFSTQDAEAQLKAMLFGGNKDSTSSSGTVSPASLPPGVQRKAKTVAELEADMHQNSPQKTSNLLSLAGSVGNPTNSADVTAFNKLLIMINAASEASHNMNQTEHQASRAGGGMVPSHSEFTHAIMRNKEKQTQLLQQSLQNVQRPAQPLSGIMQHALHPHLPPPSLHEQRVSPLSHQQAQSTVYQQFQNDQQMAMNNSKNFAEMMKRAPNNPGLPQAMSTPQPNSVMKTRVQSGNSVVSADPIFSLIQQNPAIVMNPASPAPHMTTMLAPQQSAMPSSARVPSPLIFGQQPPLHLSAPSPTLSGQLSPRSLTLGTNLTASAMSSPTGMRSPVMPHGMRSPVMPHVLSPQELSAHAQAIMQSALIKKQLQDQNERYLKKQQERAKSPSQQQINVFKPQPPAQPVLPPTPQPKGVTLDTFTPTSVLRKMHSDKVLEKEKQSGEPKNREEIGPPMHVQRAEHHADHVDGDYQDDLSQKSDTKLGDPNDMSFLNPANQQLVAMTNQLENQLRTGQTNVLPGSLSQPMSVEEKMKLLTLAEKPGYLSQMLDKSARVAAATETTRASRGRPIVKVTEESLQEESRPQQHLLLMQHQHQPSPTQMNQGARPVIGAGLNMQPSVSGAETTLAQMSSTQQKMMTKLATGRAIVGGSSVHQHQVPSASSAQNHDILRMLEQQHFQQQQHMQRLQQVPHCQGMVLPPPPMGTPIACLGPPPVAIPVSGCVPLVWQPPNSTTNAALMHQQIVQANAIAAQHNQQISHLMAMQHYQQHRNMSAVPPLHTVMAGTSTHLSPHNQAAGPLSPAALSAAIQKIASPHGALKMNGPLHPSLTASVGGPKVDLSSGIQRWFSPDILRTQLPSMPPLPAQGSRVLTVDELERS